MLVRARDAVDAWLQRRFDAVFHAIMRLTGCSKRPIRWHLWLGFIVPVLLRLVPWSVGESEQAWAWLAWPVAILVALWVVMLYGLWMQREHDWDVEAERRGMLSYADRPSNARACKYIGCFYLNMAALGFALPRLVRPDYVCVLDLIAGIAMLAQGYLCGTPPTPPPKEQRALALAGAT